jgi:hypothetical protein
VSTTRSRHSTGWVSGRRVGQWKAACSTYAGGSWGPRPGRVGLPVLPAFAERRPPPAYDVLHRVGVRHDVRRLGGAEPTGPDGRRELVLVLARHRPVRPDHHVEHVVLHHDLVVAPLVHRLQVDVPAAEPGVVPEQPDRPRPPRGCHLEDAVAAPGVQPAGPAVPVHVEAFRDGHRPQVAAVGEHRPQQPGPRGHPGHQALGVVAHDAHRPHRLAGVPRPGVAPEHRVAWRPRRRSGHGRVIRRTSSASSSCASVMAPLST